MHKVYPVNIAHLLEVTVRLNASDLHLTADTSPTIRRLGKLELLDYPAISPTNMEMLLQEILNEQQMLLFQKSMELDMSFSISGLARFRGNLMKQRGASAAVFRVIPFEVPYIEQLGLPANIEDLCQLSCGLVLVTGPAGSGKSSTLAAMINLMNRTRNINIITIEDPIEFIYENNKAIIKQREVGSDTHSFAGAMRHVLRHDPDVILIGEMRDRESISMALSAAETGHLVLSTLHTQTAPSTISRIIDVFQNDSKDQVRQQLSNTLKGVISQQLLPETDAKKRIVAVELMYSVPAIRSMIREGKEHQLYSAMQTGRAVGMQTMDQALAGLVSQGKISKQTAVGHCIDKLEIERLLEIC